MKVTYSNTPWGPKVLDDAVMADWNIKQWQAALAAAGCQPDAPIYEPTFLDAFISAPDGMGGMIRQQIGAGEGEHFNSLFATRETAEQMANLFASSPTLVDIDPGYGGGVVMEPATAYGIKVKDGRVLNAGMLASAYVRFAATDNQAGAPQFIRALIDSKIGWPTGGAK